MTQAEPRFGGGPFVKGAFFCELVLEQADGTNSYIRVVDRTTVSAELRPIARAEGVQEHAGEAANGEPPELPESLPPFRWRGMLVLMFIAGNAQGRHEVRLRQERPDGLKSERDLLGPLDIHFNRPNGGINIHARVEMEFRHEGVYWMDVLMDGEVVTRVPLEVIYQRRGIAPA